MELYPPAEVMGVAEGISEPLPIESLPGHSRLPVSALGGIAREALELGIRSILVFGIPARKDGEGSEAWSRDGIAQRSIAELKQAHGESLQLRRELTRLGWAGMTAPCPSA